MVILINVTSYQRITAAYSHFLKHSDACCSKHATRLISTVSIDFQPAQKIPTLFSEEHSVTNHGWRFGKKRNAWPLKLRQNLRRDILDDPGGDPWGLWEEARRDGSKTSVVHLDPILLHGSIREAWKTMSNEPMSRDE